MDKCFGNMAKDVIHYADDIMLATNGTLQDHLNKIEQVLMQLKVHGIKIGPSKINIAKKFPYLKPKFKPLSTYLHQLLLKEQNL